MKNLKLIELANSFVKYFKEFNVKNIPESFIKEYYILTSDNFISVVEFTEWLDVNRKTIIANIQTNYKKDTDYFFVSKEDEISYLKLYSEKNLDLKSNQKYIKITQKCFKDICIKSLTPKGILVRKYYMDLDDLFKKFHLNKIDDMSGENEVLKNNQKKSNKKIYEEEGIYVWKIIKENDKHRIGRATNILGRINDHNSSNIDKIVPEIIVYANYSEQFENLLKYSLEKFLYRGEFYKCDIKIIEKNIRSIINFLKKQNEKFIISKQIQKFYNNKIDNYKSIKKTGKKSNKKTSKKLSKKTSKKTIKK